MFFRLVRRDVFSDPVSGRKVFCAESRGERRRNSRNLFAASRSGFRRKPAERNAGVCRGDIFNLKALRMRLAGGVMDFLESCPCSGGNLPRFVQPALLAVVAREPLHGYVIARRLAETGLFGEHAPDVTGIYRMLRSMEKDGVLEVRKESSDSGPARRMYAVTPLGLRCLERWLASLAAHQEHLGRVLRFVRSARDPRKSGNGVEVPAEDAVFLEGVRRRAMEGELPLRGDILRLLSFAPGSPQAELMGVFARQMARETAGNTARVWAAIGVDCCPCAMNCAFCAFGARWGVVRRAHEWSVDEVAGAAVRFAREGASWIVLRTTEHYGRTRLRALAEAVRKVVPQDRALVANTGQMGPEEAAALKAAGISVIYHALRLGEGRDTPFDPAERRAALARAGISGLKLAHLVEPVGVEHGDGEIADVLLAALEAGAEVCGTMGRVNVPGTPFEALPAVSGERLAHIAAVTRLCGGVRTPYICVHPPLLQAVEWGANVLVVETGAVPRDDTEVAGEWRDFSVRDAKEMFRQCGYVVKEGEL